MHVTNETLSKDCPACGGIIGEGVGFPMACGCAKKEPGDMFVLKDDKALLALNRWLQDIAYNVYKSGLRDVKGQPMIGLKLDGEKRGLILCVDASLEPMAINLVQKWRME